MNKTISLTGALSKDCPESGLLELSSSSKTNALRLAEELSASLNNGSANHSNEKENVESSQSLYPISLPPCLDRSKSRFSKSKYLHHQPTDPVETARACTESILTSLSKVASGGSQASSELRQLETSRRLTDAAAKDIATAISMRQLSSFGADALGSKRYMDAARAVHDYSSMLQSQRAACIAGPHAVRAYERTRDVLQRTVLEQYENAVAESDLKGLSELTPLLGMLHLADKGVGLYLRYSQNNLQKLMNENLEEGQKVEDEQLIPQKEEATGERRKTHVTVCNKLAKLYNVAVTHLRHHLPMVAFSLGDADGDAALVQLVHIEVEKRAIGVIREYLDDNKMKHLQSKSKSVYSSIEEKCLSGEVGMDAQDLLDDGNAATLDKHKVLDMMDDCGFKKELGTISQVNGKLDEIALIVQHTESYERFIRHAVDEVNKARQMRKARKQEERKKQWMADLEHEGKEVTLEESERFDQEEKEMASKQRFQDVLPSQTQLNETIAEVGGYLTAIERAFLLANFQRSFFHSSFSNDWSLFSPLTIISSDLHSPSKTASGCRALQTRLVEEIMYAAQQSTQRAFATGHNVTASTAVNFCSDILGRILLDVLSQRAESASALLKPGDGLLPGQGGLGQAAFAVMSSAQKGISRKVAASRVSSNEETIAKQEIEASIAKACAYFNDIEVAADYTQRLEDKLNSEVQSSFPSSRPETEHLQLCIKSLDTVIESLKSSSDSAVDHLVDILMPPVRSMVNEFIRQEAGGAAGYTNVLSAGVTSTMQNVKMNYNLDEKAFEMSQIGESYMTLLCQQMEELIEPLRLHLAPRLSDLLVLGVVGGISKRLEMAIKRVSFSSVKQF